MSPEKEVIKNALHGKNVGSKHNKWWDAEITPKPARTKYTKLKLSRNLWRAWEEFSQPSDIWANASEQIAAAQPFCHVCSFELCQSTYLDKKKFCWPAAPVLLGQDVSSCLCLCLLLLLYALFLHMMPWYLLFCLLGILNTSIAMNTSVNISITLLENVPQKQSLFQQCISYVPIIC